MKGRKKENKVVFPKCVDEKKNCIFYKEGTCKLLNAENKICSFFITHSQYRDKMRHHQRLLRDRGIYR
ncbi:hypothetical protein IKD48_00745 [bacterium]|nr:hypothetical protein [bacterium]